jgi:hypothetical protein
VASKSNCISCPGLDADKIILLRSVKLFASNFPFAFVSKRKTGIIKVLAGVIRVLVLGIILFYLGLYRW